MLEFNFPRLFKAKGITTPTTYLMNRGFSDNFATGVARNRYRRFNLGDVERLCNAFQCTPNDLLEWTPDKNDGDTSNHHMASLIRNEKVLDLSRTLNSVSFDKLLAIEKLIQEEINKG